MKKREAHKYSALNQCPPRQFQNNKCQTISIYALKTSHIKFKFKQIIHLLARKANPNTSQTMYQEYYNQGKINAIMGASGCGCGKTTLLNILSGHVKSQQNGVLYANKQQYDFDRFMNFGCYVMQKDLLMEALTVKQTLQFVCELKIKQKQRKTDIINQLIRQLKLQKCLDTKIGGPFISQGVSGGQRKRVAIAFELISQPLVLILDQPTSGLDSLTSYIIMRYLKKLAQQKGRTIILTIHQPSIDIFDLFDNLMLMADRQLVFQGRSSQVQMYFTDNFNLQCPDFTNLSDYLLSILHHQKQQNLKRLPKLFETYKQAFENKINQAINNRYTNIINHSNVELPFCQTLKILTYRNLLTTIRNPLLVKSRLLRTICIGLFLGGFYWKIGGRNYADTQIWYQLTGCLFFMSSVFALMQIIPVSLTFTIQRQIFLKEQKSKMYGVFEYFLSRNIIEIPNLFLFFQILTLIVYWMMGFASTIQQFMTYYLICFATGFAGHAIGLFLGSVIKDSKSHATVTPMVLTPIVLLSGFFKNRQDLPKWIGWIQYGSPVKYSFIALMSNETQNVASNIAYLNFDFSLWNSIIILFGIGVGLQIATFIALVYRKKRKF